MADDFSSAKISDHESQAKAIGIFCELRCEHFSEGFGANNLRGAGFSFGQEHAHEKSEVLGGGEEIAGGESAQIKQRRFDFLEAACAVGHGQIASGDACLKIAVQMEIRTVHPERTKEQFARVLFEGDARNGTDRIASNRNAAVRILSSRSGRVYKHTGSDAPDSLLKAGLGGIEVASS